MFRSVLATVIVTLLFAPTALAAVDSASATAPAAPPRQAAPASANSPAPNLSTPGGGELTITNPAALACEKAAKYGDRDGAGLGQCTLALGSPLLTERDLAATYTDRGAVYLQHKEYALAKTDFDAALKLDPTIADAYVNRGAALLAMRQYADAIADIDHGLALGPDHPERAYFNRAIADEHLKDLKSAYQDYMKASQLAPDWAAPKTELARFNP